MKASHLLALTAASLWIIPAISIRSSADTPAKPGNVTEDRVIAEASDGSNWLVGGRTFDEQHFSPLKQVTDKNIGNLGLAWATDIESAMGLATEPILVDGIISNQAQKSRANTPDALPRQHQSKLDLHSVSTSRWAAK